MTTKQPRNATPPVGTWVIPAEAFTRLAGSVDGQLNVFREHLPGDPAFPVPAPEAVHLVEEARLCRYATDDEIRAAREAERANPSE